MGLRMKILSGFLILTTMLAVAGAWSIYELSTVGTSVYRLLDDNYKSINAAKRMIEALEREDSALLLLLSGNRERGRSILETADNSFEQAFKIVQGNVTIPGEQDHVASIKSTYKTYKDIWTKPIVGTPSQGSLTWYFETVHEAFLAAKMSVEQLMALNDQTMYKTASDLKNRAHRATMPGIVAILAAIIFTLIFNYFLNYYMISPIVKITESVEKVIEGRGPLDIHIETKDELSRLVSSIQQLVSRPHSPEEAE
jgi:methyl-accepting chemotaxis protein